jgi:hypothetical protein
VRPPTSGDPHEGDRPALPRPLPTAEDLAALDVQSFVARLDHNVAAVRDAATLAELLPPDAVAELCADPRFADTDRLFRSTMQGLLVATSFRDLSEAARAHPAVQERLWDAMDDMDTAVRGVGDALTALTPEERSAIGRALRDQPELGERVMDALDAEAVRAGVSDERRAHLREMGKHVCFRLRQSTPGFIDEFTGKLRRARPRELPEAERFLAAQMGQAAFEREREWQSAVREEWQSILSAERARLSAEAGDGGDAGGGISPDDAYAPPAAGAPPPPPLVNPNRGKTVLKVGAWLFGIGLLSAVTGGVLVESKNDDAVVVGLFAFTAAAVLSLGGMVCLLVGAILRLSVRSQQQLAFDHEVQRLTRGG